MKPIRRECKIQNLIQASRIQSHLKFAGEVTLKIRKFVLIMIGRGRSQNVQACRLKACLPVLRRTIFSGPRLMGSGAGVLRGTPLYTEVFGGAFGYTIDFHPDHPIWREADSSSSASSPTTATTTATTAPSSSQSSLSYYSEDGAWRPISEPR